jgi:hypothetical protein
MTKSPTALDVNRRGFLGMLFGAAVAVVAAPIVAQATVSRWGSLFQKLRGLVSKNKDVLTRGPLRPADLAEAFAQIERWDLPVSTVYMHPDDYADMLECGENLFYENGDAVGVWGAEVHVTEEAEKHEVLLLSEGYADDPRKVAKVLTRGRRDLVSYRDDEFNDKLRQLYAEITT